MAVRQLATVFTIATSRGAKVIRVETEWDRIIEPTQIADALGKVKPKFVAIVHAEPLPSALVD